jgi:hypothetical protein
VKTSIENSSPKANRTPEEQAIYDLITHDFNGLEPEVIFPLSGSITKREGRTEGREWDTLSGSDISEHGLTTVGKVRTIAGAEIAKLFPGAAVVTNSYNRFDPEEPTMASIHRDELIRRGVDAERIIMEEESFSTITQYIEMIKLAVEHGWTRLSVVINEYYKPRATALYENLDSIVEYEDPQQAQEFQEVLEAFKRMNGSVSFVVGDDIMRHMNPRWNAYFEELYTSSAYQKNVASEAKGLADLQAGEYRVRLTPENPRYAAR